MAFVPPQTRRATRTGSAAQEYVVESDSGERSAARLRVAERDTDPGVLLFAPSTWTDGGESSDWTSLTSPPARTRRLDSFGSSPGASESSGGLGRDDDFSLLPVHDGDGIFVTSGAESLRETESSASERGRARGRRRGGADRTLSHGTLGSSNDASSSCSEHGEGARDGGWALTEAALSSLSNHAPTKRFGTRNSRQRDPRVTSLHGQDNDQDEDGDLSAGFTSGSDDDDVNEGQADSGNHLDNELGQSLSALSAGIGGCLRSGRRGERLNPSRSPSQRNRLPLAAVVGSWSSVHRSLSPYSASGLSQVSSEGHFTIGSSGQRHHKSKRRHRHAAGREGGDGASSSHKRFESFEEEERQRAERMKNVLEDRLQENLIERSKSQVFMGTLADKVMSLDPSTYPLLASNNDPTPTPSRASSPSRAFQNLSRTARQELSQSSFKSIGQSYLESTRIDEEQDDEGNTTETEQEPSPHSPFGPPSPQWVHAASPPVFAPRSTLPPSIDRPRLSINATPFAIPFSSTRPRSASTTSSRPSPTSHTLPLSTTSALPWSQATAPSTTTSHEERILLSTSTVPAPWGGELDSSFELAMSVWKRFLRRLTRSSSSSSTTTHLATATPTSPGPCAQGEPPRWGVESAEGAKSWGGSQVSAH